MNFWEAVQAMDRGKTVRMSINPEKQYRLAKDGETYVCKPLPPNDQWAEPGDEWRPAIFFSRHIVGYWQVVE